MLHSRSAEDTSTSGPGALIQDGDLVIVYERHDCLKPVTVDARRSFDNRFGHFPMKAGVYLLHPTPELWTLALRHRTQILYVADISLICTFLELRPGCLVLESGTGSGSLTHSLGRCITPSGHIHTFEFHQPRAEEAEREFKAHGLERLVTVRQRNIEELGFPAELHGRADAVFLDLPGPHKEVRSAAKCLKPDGRFCSFSPCIEQIQRTAGALSRNGFHSLRTMECLLRTYDVKSASYATDLSQQPGRTGKKRKAEMVQQGGSKTENGEEELSPGAASQVQRVVAAPFSEARGHTGYLLFARRIVEEVNLPEAAMVVAAGDD